MIVTSRRIDLIEEGVDVAIRVREKLDTDADLQVKIVGRSSSKLVASPALLATHGAPATPDQVAALPTLSPTERPGIDRWTLIDAAGAEAVIVHEPRLASSEFAILRQAAIDGLGVAFLPDYACREPLADGRLQQVLPGWAGPRRHTPHGVHLAPRPLAGRAGGDRLPSGGSGSALPGVGLGHLRPVQGDVGPQIGDGRQRQRRRAAPGAGVTLPLREHLQRLGSPEQILAQPAGEVVQPGRIEVAALDHRERQFAHGLDRRLQGAQVLERDAPGLLEQLVGFQHAAAARRPGSCCAPGRGRGRQDLRAAWKL